MSETVNQGNNATNQGTEQKTFTQEELNAIVNDRLGRQKAKFADYDDLKAKAEKFDKLEEASKSELQKATEKATALQSELDAMKKQSELREIREKVAKETGVTANLLTGDTEEACVEQAKAILEFAGTQKGYPAVKDGGEAGGNINSSTRQQFADWFNQN